jgi:uncharacterized protein YebE (UPF0316 family)
MQDIRYYVGINLDVHLNGNDAIVAFVIGFAVGMIIGIVVANALK